MNPIAKLNEDQVLEIRNRANAGERRIDLADEFEVCYSTISKAVTGILVAR